MVQFSVDAAQMTAINALAFLAGEPERLSRFLGLTGLEPANIRSAARDPAFLGAVLDYLVADESLLLAFAANEGLRPQEVAGAARVLAPRESD